MKDYVIDMVPYHQRTPKLKEFLEINFDMVYNEMYGQLKDIFNLSDPEEMNSNYFQYLADYFGIIIDD
jgi:hypothetical protein